MKLIILFYISTTTALHCDKVFNYYDSYGNGFDVTCQGIIPEHIYMLKNITISQEISLTIENSTIENASADLFLRISHLKYLFIHNCVFTFPRDEQVFKYLNTLEYLEIKNTVFHITKYTFMGLDSLRHLVLSNNSLLRVEEGAFKHFTNLKRFEITLNKITDIGDLPLCDIRNVDSLNASRNNIISLNMLHLQCTQSSEIFDLNLNNQNHSLHVLENEFQSLTDYGLAITQVDLSYNKISEIGDSIRNLKFVRHLRLESNALKWLKTSELARLSDLEEIYLQNNHLEVVEDEVFENKLDLQHIDISYNKLVKFIIDEVPLLDHLNLAYNQLSNFTIKGRKTMESLRSLYLNNNKFTLLGAHIFQFYSSLEFLDLSNNKLILSEQSLNGLVNLKDLNLKNNGIEKISRSVFGSLTQLKTLDLSCNKMVALTFNKTFQYLTNLETLNISYNTLQVINYDIFKPLENLRVLDISGNKLKDIQYQLILSNLKFLSVLDIKSNLLSCETLYTIIQYLKTKNVTYTLVEKFNYERENVAGIYCSSRKEALSIINVDSNSSGSSVFVNISVVISIILCIFLFCVGTFRLYIYMKRRKYRPDEFELINE